MSDVTSAADIESKKRIAAAARLLVPELLLMPPAEFVQRVQARVPGCTEYEALGALLAVHGVLVDAAEKFAAHCRGPLN